MACRVGMDEAYATLVVRGRGSLSDRPNFVAPFPYTCAAEIFLTSKKWRLQGAWNKSRLQGVKMKSDWLFDKPLSNYWLRVAARNLASQSSCLARVSQSHCNPQFDFLRLMGRFLGTEEGMEMGFGPDLCFLMKSTYFFRFRKILMAFEERRGAWGDAIRNSDDSSSFHWSTYAVE